MATQKKQPGKKKARQPKFPGQRAPKTSAAKKREARTSTGGLSSRRPPTKPGKPKTPKDDHQELEARLEAALAAAIPLDQLDAPDPLEAGGSDPAEKPDCAGQAEPGGLEESPEGGEDKQPEQAGSSEMAQAGQESQDGESAQAGQGASEPELAHAGPEDPMAPSFGPPRASDQPACPLGPPQGSTEEGPRPAPPIGPPQVTGGSGTSGPSDTYYIGGGGDVQAEGSLGLELPIEEVVKLGAVDPLFFGRVFFPKAMGQRSPGFHREVMEALVAPQNRYVAVEVFRGGAKTTLLRVFTALRIAYGLSHTILFVSDSQAHALKSLEWLKKAVMFNRLFAEVFGLRPGVRWALEDIEIVSERTGHTARVLALGITGQIRGINIDDHRPDLIVVDDACSEENVGTPEQRQKLQQLFFGALEKSLVPRTENPHAKMVLLQTPLDRDDLVECCMRDPQWFSLRFGCFDESGESRWPERFPTEQLLADKEAHIRRNQLSLWMREMECRVVSKETSYFRAEWLRHWEILPDRMSVVMAIDPAPPVSEEARKKGRLGDYQVIVAVGFHQGKAYLLEYVMNRDQEVEELAAEFFRMAEKYRPRKVVVESVAYQRTLARYLKVKMREVGRFVPVIEVTDKRKKRDRILQALSGRAANGDLYIHASHVEFVEQFADYPDVRHDDLLDAVAMALDHSGGVGPAVEGEYLRLIEREAEVPDLPDSWRRAP